MTHHIDRDADYRRALDADHRLRALDTMVRALADLTRPDDRLCSGCVWELIVKPLAQPLIGPERGLVPEQARDSSTSSWDAPINLSELLANPPAVWEATTDTEQWLRTQEVWDAVTDTWMSLIDDADPGNGHGMGPGIE